MLDLKKTTALKSISNSNLNQVEFSYLGLTEFQKSYQLQLNYHDLIKNKNSSNIVLGFEHPAVMTLGLRAIDINPLASSLPRVRIRRGGLATIHSEGQLVIYPIIDIRSIGLGVRDFVQLLLLTTKECLLNYNIEAWADDQNIGLFTNVGKIAFCGLQIKNGVSLHGISLNVSNDLSLFEQIYSCGIENQKMDQVQNYNNLMKLENIFKTWSDLFKKNLLSAIT